MQSQVVFNLLTGSVSFFIGTLTGAAITAGWITYLKNKGKW